jgi:Sec-independent protein secretion pathway component TatC
MAGPVYLLYEISIWVAKFSKPGKGRNQEETTEISE